VEKGGRPACRRPTRLRTARGGQDPAQPDVPEGKETKKMVGGKGRQDSEGKKGRTMGEKGAPLTTRSERGRRNGKVGETLPRNAIGGHKHHRGTVSNGLEAKDSKERIQLGYSAEEVKEVSGMEEKRLVWSSSTKKIAA